MHESFTVPPDGTHALALDPEAAHAGADLLAFLSWPKNPHRRSEFRTRLIGVMFAVMEDPQSDAVRKHRDQLASRAQSSLTNVLEGRLAEEQAELKQRWERHFASAGGWKTVNEAPAWSSLLDEVNDAVVYGITAGRFLHVGLYVRAPF